MTLHELYEQMYRPLRLLGRAEGTREQYRVMLSHWWRFSAGMPLDQITELRCAEFLCWLSDGRSPATVNKVRRHITSLLRFAAERGLMAAIPLPPRLPEPEPLPQAWSVDQVERILHQCKLEAGEVAGLPACHWWCSLALALYDSGQRVGAVLSVNPGDLSLTDQAMVVRAKHQKQRRDHYCRLSGQTVDAIRPIYEPGRPRVWPWPFGRGVLFKRFRRILGRSAVPYGREAGGLFHRLRRTSGTLVEVAGGDGARHLGNSRGVFLRHYLDPRLSPVNQLSRLPRPQF